jgi:hypothetical protein
VFKRAFILLTLVCCGSAVKAQAPNFNVQSFHLISSLGSKCLGIEGGSRNPGSRAILWDCLAQPDQQFAFTPAGEIRTFAGSNLCLEVKGGLMHQMDQIDSWPCNGGGNQKWRFTNGQLLASNGMCLDLRGGAARFYLGNQDAILFPCNGQANQHFVAGVLMARGRSTTTINPGVQTAIRPLIPNPTIFIGHNGSAIVAAGAGNIVAAGAGNVVAAGAGNIVAAGAGNVIVPAATSAR